jgi:hypothetical protein
VARYPGHQGPRQRAKQNREKKENRAEEIKNLPYKTVRTLVCGQMVTVRVYPPAWAQGHKREQERLGFDPTNPFSRDRTNTLRRKALAPKGPKTTP